MRAIRIEKTGGVEVLDGALKEVAIPELGENEVLIRNEYAGVNYVSWQGGARAVAFIDTYHRSGLYKVDLPFGLGRDCAGTAVKVGAGVTEIKPNDRVVALAPGSYADYSLAPLHLVSKIPTGLETRLACAAFLQGLTALTLVRKAHEVKANETVLIQAAAGGTGLLLCQLCRHFGATVIGTCSTAEKAELALANGAHHVINYREHEDDWPEKVLDLTPDRNGCHAVFDGVGKSTWEGSMKVLRRLGSMVSFGNASGSPDPVPLPSLSAKNIKVMRPSLFGYMTTSEDRDEYCPELFSLVQQGVLRFKIYKEYPLEEAKQCHIDITSRGTTGKLLIKL